MKNKKKTNNLQGDRLRECLRDANITQIQLSRLTNYTVQHINNIVTGKRNMSVESARAFSKKLGVSEEYLLGESNYKTIYDEINHKVFEQSVIFQHIEKLIYCLGYRKKCKYWYGWDNLDCPGHTAEEISDFKDHTTKDEIISSFSHFARLAIEIEKPNHDIMTCNEDEYLSAILEIAEYVRFKMDILEKNFNFDLYDQNDEPVHRSEESIVQIFDNK